MTLHDLHTPCRSPSKITTTTISQHSQGGRYLPRNWKIQNSRRRSSSGLSRVFPLNFPYRWRTATVQISVWTSARDQLRSSQLMKLQVYQQQLTEVLHWLVLSCSPTASSLASSSSSLLPCSDYERLTECERGMPSDKHKHSTPQLCRTADRHQNKPERKNKLRKYNQ